MKPKIYNDFSSLKEATSVKIEITFSTTEEIALINAEREQCRLLARRQKYNKEWLDTKVFAIIDTEPEKVVGKWVSEEEYITFINRKLINKYYEPYKVAMYVTRRQYFAELKLRNNK